MFKVKKRLKFRSALNAYLQTFIFSYLVIASYSITTVSVTFLTVTLPLLLAYVYGSVWIVTKEDIKQKGIEKLESMASKSIMLSLIIISILFVWTAFDAGVHVFQTKEVVIGYIVSNIISFGYLLFLADNIDS